MVLGSHVIIGMYGFWLPNDERGSWSDFVGSWELLRFGRATMANQQRSTLAGGTSRQAGSDASAVGSLTTGHRLR